MTLAQHLVLAIGFLRNSFICKKNLLTFIALPSAQIE